MGDALTLEAAAARLGLTTEAVRKRCKRGTLRGEKVNGYWVVYLDEVASAASHHPDMASRRVDEQLDDRTEPAGQQPDANAAVYRELVDTLQSENARLWEQIQVKDQVLAEKDEQIRAWIDEAKRKDMLLAHLQERIVELPSSTPESHSDAPDNTQDKPEPRQEPAAPIYSYRIPEPATRPWWQFWRRP